MRRIIVIAVSAALLGGAFSAQAGRDEVQMRQQDKANKEAATRRQQQMPRPAAKHYGPRVDPGVAASRRPANSEKK